MYGIAKWKLLTGLFVNFMLISCAYLAAVWVFTDDYSITQNYLVYAFVSAFVFVLSQFIFIIPLAKPPKISPKGRSLKAQIIIAGFMGSVLATIFAMLVASVIATLILGHSDDFAYPVAIYSGIWITNLHNITFEQLSEPLVLIVLGYVCLTWIVWSAIVWKRIQSSGQDVGVLARVTGQLLAGSLIELLLSIPLFYMVQKKSDCYCGTGSFGALVMSIMACLWLLGPFVFIVIFWRKRPWTRTHCSFCGYPRKVKKTLVCSECGTQLKQG